MNEEKTDEKKCLWSEDSDRTWETGCGDRHIFECEGPAENKYKFCPYCGIPIQEMPFTGPVD